MRCTEGRLQAFYISSPTLFGSVPLCEMTIATPAVASRYNKVQTKRGILSPCLLSRSPGKFTNDFLLMSHWPKLGHTHFIKLINDMGFP